MELIGMLASEGVPDAYLFTVSHIFKTTISCAHHARSGRAKFLRFADKIVMTKVQRREARCDFAGIKPGTYALAIIHDENLNGELDTNFFGVPTEGYGFSSDAKAFLSAPSFSAASFSYNGQSLDLTIRLNY